MNYPFNTYSLPKFNIILCWQPTHEQLLKLNITFSWPKPILPTMLHFSQSIPHDMLFCDYMNAAFLLINRFIFRSQMGENQSSFNSLLSILWQPTATFFTRVTEKLLIAGMLKLIKVRTVGSPTGGSAVEESFPEARAQTIHHCPSAKLYNRENELKTLMEAQGRIQGFHKKTDKKARGRKWSPASCRWRMDKNIHCIATSSLIPSCAHL